LPRVRAPQTPAEDRNARARRAFGFGHDDRSYSLYDYCYYIVIRKRTKPTRWLRFFLSRFFVFILLRRQTTYIDNHYSTYVYIVIYKLRTYNFCTAQRRRILYLYLDTAVPETAERVLRARTFQIEPLRRRLCIVERTKNNNDGDEKLALELRPKYFDFLYRYVNANARVEINEKHVIPMAHVRYDRLLPYKTASFSF